MKGKKSITFKHIKKHWQLYILLLPAVLYVLVYNYFPMYGVQIAFRDFSVRKGILGSDWVGLKYFIKFFNSYTFWQLLRNTIGISIVSLIFTFPLPIILALMLNQLKKKKFKGFVQTVLYAPNFITVVVLVGMLNVFLSPHTGVINLIIKALGNEPIFFMGESNWFLPIYVLSAIWQGTGFGAIIYLGALSGVSPELYEAAKIDGANRFQVIRYVDIPCIMPTVVTMFILAIGGVMNVGFEKVLLMQNDLNVGVANVISTYVYNIGIVDAQYSYSAAIGLFNTIINAILLVIANTVSKKVTEVGIW